MFVRTAGERDLSAVGRFIADNAHAAFDPFYGAEMVGRIVSRYYSAAALEQQFARPRSELLVADDGNSLGGVAFAAAIGDDARVIELVLLFVRPDLQGHGIGGMLLHEIEDSFFESELLRVEVDERNVRAVAFYLGQGLVEVSRADATNAPAVLLTFEKSLV